ncbi:MAG: hypothetical protein IT438_07510 [Phycisphaerales bacterium]|nr:hypothetical protein [Phycisphaerales bacterium]
MKTTKLVITEVLLLLLTVSTSSASGQTRGDSGWDLADPINKAETRQFAVRLWAVHDGMTRQSAFSGFAFTNAPPSNLITLFTQAEELFNTLYSHRLHHDPFSETYYDIWDLVRDDACIREQFRSYTTTGNLTVSSVCDSVAATKHALAVADGLTSSSEFVVAYAHVESSGDLASTELQTHLHRRPRPAQPYLPPDRSSPSSSA